MRGSPVIRESISTKEGGQSIMGLPYDWIGDVSALTKAEAKEEPCILPDEYKGLFGVARLVSTLVARRL